MGETWTVGQLQDFRSRVRGCLLGGAIGDMLGAGIEFSSLTEIRSQYGPAGVMGVVPAYHRFGAITDDTQMTLFTVDGLIRAYVRKDRGEWHPPSEVHRAYLRWMRTQHQWGPDEREPSAGWLDREEWLYAQRAPGTACLSGLRDPVMGTLLAPKNPDSKGAGAVMRSAPFGLLAGWGAELVFQLAAECATLTHGHPTGYLAAGAFAVIVHAAVQGISLREGARRAVELLRTWPSHEETVGAIERALAAADEGGQGTPERVEQLGAGWVAEETLSIGLYAALVGTDARAALLLAVNHSGDSDSTGSVCGNLLGAAGGETVFPPHWVAQVEGRGTIVQLADDFAMELTQGDQLHGAQTDGRAWRERYPVE